MDFLYTFHSHNRWLVLLAAVAALLKLTITWLRGTEYAKSDRIITGIFSGLLSLQVVLGLVLLFWLGISRYRLEHGVMMIIALGLVHFSARWKSSPGPVRARNTAAVIVTALVLIAVGITLLPQGWTPTRLP
jgi:preprotein translocase subunit SecY